MIILGISASLRNRRFSYKNGLIEELKKIPDLSALNSFIKEQIKITFDDIGKDKDKELNFEEKYKLLKKYKGDRGLSNSEASLAYGLWQAYKNGSEIDYLSLSNIFENPNKEKLNFFKNKFLQCNGLLVSGPVYFGDRGSMAQKMIEYLNSDDDCMSHVKKIIYAGLAVGAKRNGGQETTLIFQMLDFLNMGCKVVGNGHETTSQYGGTLVAGDIGKLQSDEYGIKTALSTGKHLSEIVKKIDTDESKLVKNKYPHICNIFVLQDNIEEECTNLITKLIKNSKQDKIKFNIIKVFKEKVHPCIACDICPVEYGEPSEYRCIIKNKDDFFNKNHKEIVECDSFIFACYSGENFKNIKSNYQEFVERTRYLRRDDYLLGSKLVTSFVLSEVSSNRNLHIRTLTSLIRHQNVLSKPILVFKSGNTFINLENIKKNFNKFCDDALKVRKLNSVSEYKPVGYEISMEKYKSKKQTV